VTGAPPRGGWSAAALLALAGMALAWGCNWSFMKLVFVEFPVWGFRGVSGVVAALTILAAAAARGGRAAIRPRRARDWRWLTIAGVLNVTIWQVTTAYGVQVLGAGHAAVLAFTMPLWSGLLAVTLLGERPGWSFAAAVAMGTGGVTLLSIRDGGFVLADLPGMALMLAAAIFWAVGTLYAKRDAPDLSVLVTTGWQLLLGSLPILALAPLLEPLAWPRASAAAWGAAAYLTFVALIVGYLCWFRLVDLLPGPSASLASLAVPATAMATGAMMLGEPFGPRETAALALLLGALTLVILLPPRNRPRAAATD
jgi:drug/metabolite transporter (DMT)-like permease